MAIRKSKINIDTEERSDFDNMMNDIENEVEEQQAEDGLVNRVPELKQLSEDIPIPSAILELESAIQQYQRAETKLGGAVTTISKKVDTINLTDGSDFIFTSIGLSEEILCSSIGSVVTSVICSC